MENTPDFKEIQNNLRNAKQLKEHLQKEIFLFNEKLKKVARKKEHALRSNSVQSDILNQLEAEKNILDTELAAIRIRLGEQLGLTDQLVNTFKELNDPRESIEQFSDAYPVLLLPLRLETRFKRITRVNSEESFQLWVRIFPDECSIDTFESVLSEAEMKKSQDYWKSIWSTGKTLDEDIEGFIR